MTDATVVLPELFNTGYLFRSQEELNKLAEPVTTGYTVGEMKKLAKQKRLNLVFGMAEKKARKVYNSSILITNKGKVFTYQKVHLYDREKLFFTPGDKSFEVHEARNTPEAVIKTKIGTPVLGVAMIRRGDVEAAFSSISAMTTARPTRTKP